MIDHTSKIDPHGDPETLIPADLKLPNYVSGLVFLAHGGMGAVYQANHRVTRAKLAVKVLLPDLAEDKDFQTRFLQEAKVMGTLSHPNIVQVIDAASSAKCTFVIMEFIDGIPLSQHIRENGPLNLDDAIEIFSQVALGLEHAHNRGIIHRDLKPSNIMLHKKGDGSIQVKVVDFGIAKFVDPSINEAKTATGDVLGTPLYMSPEQCMAEPLDNRSDLYSIGCVIYQSLCGEAPLTGTTAVEVLLKHKSMAVDFSKVPEAMRDIVARCMEKEARDRYQSASELHADLQRVKGSRKAAFRITGDQRRALKSAITVFLAIAIGFAVSYGVSQVLQNMGS